MYISEKNLFYLRLTAGVNIPQASQDTMAAKNFSSRYKIVRAHSKGGMGSISVVYDSILEREIAVKTIHSRHLPNENFRNLLVREAQITGNLQHPNIVPVYELSHSDPEQGPYYTMRLVRGDTLATHIHKFYAQKYEHGENRTEFYRLLNAVVSISQTIAYAHSRGVLHLDLKPSNVVLGEFGQVIVLDWGLSEALPVTDLDDAFSADHKGDQKPIVVGTPAYMSPEQKKGQAKDIGSHSDVYGLGAILYQLLTGKPPHPLIENKGTSSETETIPPLAKNVHSGAILDDYTDTRPFHQKSFPDREIERDETLHDLKANKSVPPELKAVCLHALSQNPGTRYRKVTDLVEDLQRWLADEPVSVYKSHWYLNFHRWIRRHRTLTAVCSCVILFLLLFTANLFRLSLLDRQDQLTNALVYELTTSEEAVRAVGSYFRTEETVLYPEFRRFVRPYLESSEELLALEWIPRVTTDERTEVEAYGAKFIHPNFEFKETGADGELIRASERNIYYPVLYVEPLERNLKAIGFDLRSSETRFEAIQAALTTRREAACGPVNLLQSTKETMGMLAFLPVFLDTENSREGTPATAGLVPPPPPVGLVLGVYEIHTLIDKAWENISTKHLTVEVYDITEADTPVFLWGNVPGPPQLQRASLANGSGLLSIRCTSRELSVLNHTWKICIQAHSPFLLYYPTSR